MAQLECQFVTAQRRSQAVARIANRTASQQTISGN